MYDFDYDSDFEKSFWKKKKVLDNIKTSQASLRRNKWLTAQKQYT